MYQLPPADELTGGGWDAVRSLEEGEGSKDDTEAREERSCN